MNSLRLKNVEAASSGTVANKYKDVNKINFPKTLALLRKHGVEEFAKSHYADQLTQGQLINADLVVFMNRIAFNEGHLLCDLPVLTIIWDVTDIGEEGRIAKTEKERDAYSEDVYSDITNNVDALVDRLNQV